MRTLQGLQMFLLLYQKAKKNQNFLAIIHSRYCARSCRLPSLMSRFVLFPGYAVRPPYRSSTPFQYFVSLTGHKILEEGLAEWVPTHSSPILRRAAEKGKRTKRRTALLTFVLKAVI